MIVQQLRLSQFVEEAGAPQAVTVARLWEDPAITHLVLFSDALGHQAAVLPVGPHADYKDLDLATKGPIEGLWPKAWTFSLASLWSAWTANLAPAGEIEARLADIEARAKELDSRAEQLELIANEIEKSSRDLGERTAEFEQRNHYIADCEARIAGQAQRLTEHEAQLEQLRAELVERQGKLDQREAELVEREQLFFRRASLA